MLTIGFVSGMYVANNSMLTSADEGVSKYKQEDGHFELRDKADSELVKAIESGEVKTAPDEKTAIAAKLLSRSTRISIAMRLRTTMQTAKGRNHPCIHKDRGYQPCMSHRGLFSTK